MSRGVGWTPNELLNDTTINPMVDEQDVPDLLILRVICSLHHTTITTFLCQNESTRFDVKSARFSTDPNHHSQLFWRIRTVSPSRNVSSFASCAS